MAARHRYDALAFGQHRVVRGVPRDTEPFGDPRHRQVLDHDASQRPTPNAQRGPVWAAVSSASPQRRRLWAAVASGYAHIAPEFAGATALPKHTGVWSTGRLDVNITPHLTLDYPEQSRRDLVWIHAKVEPPSEAEIDMTLWLLAQVTDELLPGATPLFLDVRRAHLARPRRFSGDWLHGEAAAYAELAERLAVDMQAA